MCIRDRIGNIFLQQLVIRSIVANGTSRTYFVFGLVSLVVALVIALFLVKMPKDSSEVVGANNNSSEKEVNKEVNKEETDISYTLKEAQGIKYFWMIGLLSLIHI